MVNEFVKFFSFHSIPEPLSLLSDRKRNLYQVNQQDIVHDSFLATVLSFIYHQQK